MREELKRKQEKVSEWVIVAIATKRSESGMKEEDRGREKEDLRGKKGKFGMLEEKGKLEVKV